MTAAALPFPASDNAHRPFPHDMIARAKIGPEISDHLQVCGCGYWSPELSQLMTEHSRAEIVRACDTLNMRPIRANVAKLREYLDAQEAKLK